MFRRIWGAAWLVLAIAALACARSAAAASGITALRCELDDQGKLANILYKVGDVDAWLSTCKWDGGASAAGAAAAGLGDVCLDDALALVLGVIQGAKGPGAKASRPEGVVLRGANGDLHGCGSLGGGNSSGGAFGALAAGKLGLTEYKQEGKVVSGLRAQCAGKAGRKRIKSLKPRFSPAPEGSGQSVGPAGVPACCMDLASFALLHPGESNSAAFLCCSEWIQAQGASVRASGGPAVVSAVEKARTAALTSGLSEADAEAHANFVALFGQFSDTCPPDESKNIWAPPITRCDLPVSRPADWDYRKNDTAQSTQVTPMNIITSAFSAEVKHAPLPNVTAAMMYWWFNNIDGDTVDPRTNIPTTKYLLWHPRAHQVQQTVVPSGVPGNATGAYWYIRELFMPHAAYVRDSQPPPDWAWDFFCNIVLHVMKLDSNGLEMGFQIGNTLPPPVRLTHEWQDSPEGLQVTSRMFYGLQSFTLSNALLVKFVNYVALKSYGGDCPQEAAWKWVNHCIEEVGNLPFFLPGLYEKAVGGQ